MEKFRSIEVFALVLLGGVLTNCGRYYSRFDFRGSRNGHTPSAQTLVVDSGEVRDRIHAEELRQADEKRQIRELPPPRLKDSAAAGARLKAYDNLIDLEARAAFLSDLKAMANIEVPTTAKGLIVGRSECWCTLSSGSTYHLVKVRFKVRGRRIVEGWICQEAITMLHNFDL